MSLHDPSATRPGRITFAALVFAASLAAAGVAGWGWDIGSVPSREMGAHAVAVFLGQFSAIGLAVATGFALPVRWRTPDRALPLILGQMGLQLLAVCAGLAVARASLPGPVLAPSLFIVAGLGIALVLTASAARMRSLRRAAVRDELITTGRQTVGLVTAAAQTGMVNDVPRWRVVVRFQDTAGNTRWVTKHTTTWQPPSTGQQAVVYFDPARPGNRRRIAVSW